MGPVSILANTEASGVTRGLVDRVSGELGEAHEDAALLLSELASNVVRHTDCHVLAVSISIGTDSARFEVFDSEPDHLPELVEREADRVGGFGLALVETLSADWGIRVDTFGKSVWFELPVG